MPKKFTGSTMKYHNEKISGKYQLTDPMDETADYSRDARHKDAAELLDKYNSDPDFKTLADAARHYVHNYQAIGDIDKLSLGESAIHNTTTVEGLFNVDPDTALLDGTRDGRLWLDMTEGTRMVEALYSAIRNASENNTPLYRGVTAVNLPLRPGDVFSMPLSSFSLVPDTAYDFGHIVFEIEGPSKHMSVMPFNAYSEQEYLTQGRFEVLSDEPRHVERAYSSWSSPVLKAVRYIKIRQIGVH